MRTTSALDTLFPGVLTATLTRPEKWWYLSELANFLHTRPSSLQRELAALVQGGILEQRRDGRRTYFKAETRSPIFRDLRRRKRNVFDYDDANVANGSAKRV